MIMRYDYNYSSLRDSTVVMYDKGKDNDGTLRTKLTQAMNKHGVPFEHYNKLMKKLKRDKSVVVN